MTHLTRQFIVIIHNEPKGNPRVIGNCCASFWPQSHTYHLHEFDHVPCFSLHFCCDGHQSTNKDLLVRCIIYRLQIYYRFYRLQMYYYYRSIIDLMIYVINICPFDLLIYIVELNLWNPSRISTRDHLYTIQYPLSPVIYYRSSIIDDLQNPQIILIDHH